MDGIARHLADHRFSELFRDELGWDRTSGTFAIEVDGDRRLAFEAIAQKRGLQSRVYRGPTDSLQPGFASPGSTTDRESDPRTHTHFLVQ